MSISKGITLATTEQITNTKLHTLVDSATISLQHTEIANNMLTSLASASGFIGGARLNNLTSIATGAGQLRYWSLVTSLASGALVRFNGSTGFYASMT